MLSASSISSTSSLSGRSHVSISSPFGDLEAFSPSTTLTSVSKHPEKNHAFSSMSPPIVKEPDDLLGLLGQPVSASQSAKPSASLPSPRIDSPHSPQDDINGKKSINSVSLPSRAVAARTPSPPPHVLGQVVSMGFSVQQARLALAATLGPGTSEGESHWDVQAAAENLASDGAAAVQRARDGSSMSGSHNGDPRQQPRRAPRRQTDRNSERESGPANLQKNTPSHVDGGEDVSNAEDLLAQASAIGFSVLKSANAYWKTSKAQLAKALEEKNKFLSAEFAPGPSSSKREVTSPGTSRSATPSSGRPRWMSEDCEDTLDYEKDKIPAPSDFRDLDDEDHPDSILHRAKDASKRSLQEKRNVQEENVLRSPPSQTQFKQAQPSMRAQNPPAAAKPASLDLPKAERQIYASPNRRKPLSQASPILSTSPNNTGTNVSTSHPTPKPNVTTRVRVSASFPQVVAANLKRASGNEHYKLGRYGEAVEAYTAALATLPEGHLSRIAILNNRANARLKIGEERKAVEDARGVLELLLFNKKVDTAKKEDYLAVLSELEGYTSEGTEDKLNQHDALGKALSRRAIGSEAGENWRLAMLDWQMIVELGDQRVLKSAGGMKPVSDGLARCRKVVDRPFPAANGQLKIASSAKARLKSKPQGAMATQKPMKPSAAVKALRENTVQAEAEESERLRVKDSVDARIESWRSGKESNARALIASLDIVLWADLGWNKIGMHELITDGQLKVRYVRAISKVHPDKVSHYVRPLQRGQADPLGFQIPKNASVEERMIAAAVFTTLNDAWNATSK